MARKKEDIINDIIECLKMSEIDLDYDIIELENLDKTSLYIINKVLKSDEALMNIIYNRMTPDKFLEFIVKFIKKKITHKFIEETPIIDYFKELL